MSFNYYQVHVVIIRLKYCVTILTSFSLTLAEFQYSKIFINYVVLHVSTMNSARLVKKKQNQNQTAKNAEMLQQ